MLSGQATSRAPYWTRRVQGKLQPTRQVQEWTRHETYAKGEGMHELVHGSLNAVSVNGIATLAKNAP